MCMCSRAIAKGQQSGSLVSRHHNSYCSDCVLHSAMLYRTSICAAAGLMYVVCVVAYYAYPLGNHGCRCSLQRCCLRCLALFCPCFLQRVGGTSSLLWREQHILHTTQHCWEDVMHVMVEVRWPAAEHNAASRASTATSNLRSLHIGLPSSSHTITVQPQATA